MLFLNEDTKYINSVYTKNIEEMDALVENAGISPEYFNGYFNDDPAIAAVEILSEMNSGWNALEKDMILCEAHAVINGETLNESFSDTMKAWWKKIREFFTKIWGSITGFFRKVWIWLSTKFQNAEKWWKANEKDITISELSEKLKGYPKLADGSYETVEIAIPKDPADSKDAYTSWKESADKDSNLDSKKIQEAIYGSDKAVEVTVTKANCGKVILGYKAVLDKLKKAQDDQAKNIKDAIETAKKGESTDNKEESEKLTAKIQFLKKKQSLLQEISKRKITAASEACVFAFKGAKYLLAESKRGGKGGNSASNSPATSSSSSNSNSSSSSSASSSSKPSSSGTNNSNSGNVFAGNNTGGGVYHKDARRFEYGEREFKQADKYSKSPVKPAPAEEPAPAASTYESSKKQNKNPGMKNFNRPIYSRDNRRFSFK